MIELNNCDNMIYNNQHRPNLIYADYIYENTNFDWIDKYWEMLSDDGIFIGQTDYHSSAEFYCYLKYQKNANFVNWLVWKNEFGNFRKDRFRQCHDDIIIFSKSKEFYFDNSKIQVEKATVKSKSLNKSGRTTKIATSVITDICLTTVAHERIKKDDGKNIRWQKPKELFVRIFSPFLLPGQLVLDPFMGSGTSCEVALDLECDYVGIEYDSTPYNLAKIRLENYVKNKSI
jgi:site-specific DNA-methyltransferase (adenine-specific)